MNERCFSIQLNDMEFYAFHGVHPREQRAGNLFLVDVRLTIRAQEPAWTANHLESTFNYETAWQIVSTYMQEPQKLLETLVIQMHNALINLPEVDSAWVRIRKTNPPFPGKCHSVSVSFPTHELG
jgi:dihydroneopterin aldolase